MASFQIASETHTLRIPEWEEAYPNLVVGFTLRTGGESIAPFASQNMGLHVGDDPSAVIRNREALSNRLQIPFDGWTCADQVHGNHVERISLEQRGAGRQTLADCIRDTDGLHTNEAGLLLTSFYADCVPLYFFAPEKRAIGLAHAGWKGTVSRIAEEMIRAFQHEYGCSVEEIHVAIGPSIRGCCYEVDERIITEVKKASDNWQECITDLSNGKYLLDLAEVNQSILIACGLKQEQIMRSHWCTSCHPELFYSYRKEGGKTGRMASFMGWRT